MDRHLKIQRMAAKAFEQHGFRRGPGFCWTLHRPRSWTYGFRVTWSPGAVIVTGDLGEAVYRVPGLDPWATAQFVSTTDYHYLTGKSACQTVYDRDATVRSLLEAADEQQRHGGDRTLWTAIVDHYGWMGDDEPRVRIAQMKAASHLRQDIDLTAETVYRLAGDSELIRHSYPPQSRWTYEAVQLWAKRMLETEPTWSRIRRALRRLRQTLQGYRRRPPIYRPEVYVASGHINGSRYWRRTEGPKGDLWRAVTPWKLGALKLHRIGFWRDQGSSWAGEPPWRTALVAISDGCLP